MLGTLAACNSSSTPAASTPPLQALPGTQVRMALAIGRGVWEGPFPSDDLRTAIGFIGLDTFPNPNQVTLLSQAQALLTQDQQGFSLTAPIFLSLSGPIDPKRLPDVKGSTEQSATVFVSVVHGNGQRHPVEVHFEADGGPNGTSNLLSILPLQGVPLRPNTTYAAVVLRSLGDAAGQPLGRSEDLAKILNTDGMSTDGARYHWAAHWLESQGIHRADIAGLAVFQTGDPAAQMEAARKAMLQEPLPLPKAWTRTEVYDDYCVYQTSIDMPDYQGGTPPFQSVGGGWVTNHQTGAPIRQRLSTSSLFVTIPRQPMPAAGYPPMVFVRTGGGGDRPLIDRGVQPATGQPASIPGTGPAMWFAKAGFAGIQVDGPLGGLRNITHADEQFLIFNVMNAAALRDNIRESALELMMLARIVPTLQVDTADCPGASPSAYFDVSFLGLMGHSTGAWIAQLVLAFEPAYQLAILSGAGSSYLENIVHKLHPVATRPIAEGLLGYDTIGRALSDHDPALMLVEWAAEPSDPQVYNHAQRRHVLMLQGIVDGYILPAIANPTTLSMGLDLAGEALDAKNEELKTLNQQSILDLLPFVGLKQLTLPVKGNNKGEFTTVVVQHPGDGIEDGHEVVFQTEAPKHQIICFLKSFLSGVPTVVPGAPLGTPCP